MITAIVDGRGENKFHRSGPLKAPEVPEDKDDERAGYTNSAIKLSTDFGGRPTSTVIEFPEKASPGVTSDREVPLPFGDEENPDVIDTWWKFTQDTTFHGIRYIFNRKSRRLRRFLWILVVVAAISLFMFQVIDRGNDYYSYPSNVNVEVVYRTELDFPSVTLCNQNNYRLTETVRRGMYKFLDGAYSGLSFTPDNQTTLGADDLLTFATSSAHQKGDLIDSCIWKGQPCDMETDIVTTLTDFGVCYTFNSGHHGNIFQISRSGSGFALSLVLNIEAYEYMNGPHDEAGMKVLLHDASEVPLVQDLGFAIAPGTHTLVAVHREQIHSLQHPYGTCEEGIVPRSHCVAQCRAQDVVEACGCRDVHSPNITVNDTAVEICPVLEAFTCLKKRNEELVRSGRDCVCGIPCETTTYRPELSYAHLSRLSVDKIWLSDDDKRQRLQQSYRGARETYQRANEAIVRADTLRYTGLLETSQDYFQWITDSYNAIRDPDTLQTLIGSRKTPLDSSDEIEADLAAIEIEHSKLWSLRASTATHPNLQDFTKLITYIDRYFLTYTESRPLGILIKLAECADLQANANVTADELLDQCDTWQEPLVTAMAEANPTTGDTAPYSEPTTRRFIKVLNTTLSDYQDVIKTLYENTAEWDDVITSPSHLQCLELLQNTTEDWIPIMVDVKNKFSTFYYTDSFAERRDISYNMWELSQWTKTSNDSITREDAFKVCSWYQDETTATDPSLALFKQYATSVKNALPDSLGLQETLFDGLKAVAADYQTKAEFMFGPFHEFLVNNTTKMGLYTHLKSSAFSDTYRGVDLTHLQVQTDTNSFSSRIHDIEYNYIQALGHSFNFSVWVMRDDFVQNLKFVNFIEKSFPNDQYMQTTLPQLTYENSSLFGDIVSRVFSTYRTGVLTKVGGAALTLSRQDGHMKDTTKDLEEFEEGNHLNEQFFMDNYIKVDIFYKELSYNKISQQVAFEFISYLSEVGGFLGLLLGASVLTVCELVDYLTVAAIKRCRTERMVSK